MIHQAQEIEAGILNMAQKEAAYTISVQATEGPETAKKIDLLTEIQNAFMEVQTKKLNTILKNQKAILEMQNKFAQQLASLAVKVDGFTKTLINQKGRVTLAKANGAETPAFKIKYIDNVEDLDEFEMMLSDPAQKQQLIQQYSILCSESKGEGVTFAYKLCDLLFTREFLCRCSWSGGSRNDTIKVAVKRYKNILDFFFRMIHSWDKVYTVQDNEAFFKTVLRNSERRRKTKNIRASTKKNRRKKQSKESDELKANGDAAIIGVNSKRKRTLSA